MRIAFPYLRAPGESLDEYILRRSAEDARAGSDPDHLPHWENPPYFPDEPPPPLHKVPRDLRCYFCGNRAEVYVNGDVPSCGRHGR